MEQGYIQLYTGNGKGKTTAALGITLRCLCAGNKVFFGQFMKGQDYSELKAVSYFERLTMKQFGTPSFVNGKPSDIDLAQAKEGFEVIKEALLSGLYDMVVFDEVNTALHFGLLEIDAVLDLLDQKPGKTEVILTGRYAPQALLDRADLVTEMKEIKHYYQAGVPARVGIED